MCCYCFDASLIPQASLDYDTIKSSDQIQDKNLQEQHFSQLVIAIHQHSQLRSHISVNLRNF